MAQDYHIYIHGGSSNSNGGGNQTKPFSLKDDTSLNREYTSVAKQSLSYGKMAATGGGLSMGVSALTKVAPWVAVIVAGVKIADKILSTGFAHQEEYTGNYKNNVNYNNFKSMVSNVLNPIGYGLKLTHESFQMQKQNKQIEQQNKLLGKSVLQNFNIGV